MRPPFPSHVRAIKKGPDIIIQFLEDVDALQFWELDYEHTRLDQLIILGRTDVTDELRVRAKSIDEDLALVRKLAESRKAKTKAVLRSHTERRVGAKPAMSARVAKPESGDDGGGEPLISDDELFVATDLECEADDWSMDELEEKQAELYPPAMVVDIGGPTAKVNYMHPVVDDVLWGTQTTLHRGTKKESISLKCHLHGCRLPNRQTHQFCGRDAVTRWLRDGVYMRDDDARRKHEAAYRLLPAAPPG